MVQFVSFFPGKGLEVCVQLQPNKDQIDSCCCWRLCSGFGLQLTVDGANPERRQGALFWFFNGGIIATQISTFRVFGDGLAIVVHRSASILATANGGEKCGFLINHGVENLSPSFDDASEAKVSKVRGHPLSRHVTTKTAVSSVFFFFAGSLSRAKGAACAGAWEGQALKGIPVITEGGENLLEQAECADVTDETNWDGMLVNMVNTVEKRPNGSWSDGPTVRWSGAHPEPMACGLDTQSFPMAINGGPFRPFHRFSQAKSNIELV